MSLYVEWLNKIKERATEKWLTNGQKEAYQDILNKPWGANTFIALCGPKGCGKTFIARLLSARPNYFYTKDLNKVEEGISKIVILDDVEYTRRLRSIVTIKDIEQIIIITEKPPTDPMPIAFVKLSERDVRQFLNNLCTHCDIKSFKTEPKGTDLEQVIIDEIGAKGGNNVS